MTESPLLTHKQSWDLFEIALRAARAAGAPDIEVTVEATDSSLTRFANNAIHQNVSERRHTLSARVLLDHRTARVTTNRFDESSIRDAVEQAVAIARVQEPDPEVPPLAAPSRIPEVRRWHESTALASPADRAARVADAIRLAEAAGQTAAGIYSTGQMAEAILNSKGVFAYCHDTLAQFSITCMSGDSSGWAKATAPATEDFDPLELACRASRKAALSRSPRELPPGAYTVILEPSAVLDLVGQIFPDFSATALHDQRSFLNDRLGKRIFGENITVCDDACHPLQTGPPYDGEGVPRKKLALIEKGVPREVARSRAAALREGLEPTGHAYPLPSQDGEAPVNIVIEGGKTSVEEMIASTGRGVLVTRLWYIREVDPYEKIMTGMTRDGTFLVESGEVVCGLKNFRFNESVVDLLNRVVALSPAIRASGEEACDMVVPAMKVEEFHFTEGTKF